jgi:cytochrome P450
MAATIKETLRRYPVTGNLAKRYVDRAGSKLNDTYDVPVGTSLFMHMYSLHNTTRAGHWGPDALQFDPTRWLPAAGAGAGTGTGTSTNGGSVRRPTCPFMRTGFNDTSKVNTPCILGNRLL